MKTILIIEDTADVRENIGEILELANYHVLLAKNGKVGVDLAVTHLPDLIVCDVMMPELDGFGVLHILSKNPKTAGIPFIFLTARADRTDFRKGMNLGADDYLTKPFEEVELLDAIETRLKKNEIFTKQFNSDLEGFHDFVSEARGIEELNTLSESYTARQFRKKTSIFHESDHPIGVYFINAGKVKTFMVNEDGKEFITGIYNAGDFLGYTELLEETTYRESAVALENSEIAMIPQKDFYSLVFNNRDVANKFIKILANDLLEKESQLLKLAYNSVRKRVAEALVQLHDKYREEGQTDDQVKFNILREDLASLVGTAKETVIRTLSDFKDERLITIGGGKIQLLDKVKLKNLRN